MNIKQDMRVVRGEHKGIEFTYEDGIIEWMGQRWSKERLKILIETVTLLEAHGHIVKDRLPMSKKHANPLFLELWGINEMTKYWYGEQDEEDTENP